MDNDNIYTAAYSELNLWRKLTQSAGVAGINVVERVLMLYYALRRARTPRATKALIVGTLGYFIIPVDAIPDAILGAGYTDDLGALTWMCHTVRPHITDSIMREAERKALRWLQPGIERQQMAVSGTE
jgi:uncharacterized membrane protein YkvA (DUF1232 family)